MARIAEVGEQRAGGLVQHAQARALSDIFGRSIGANLVQAVRQAARLAHVDLVHAVVVDVGDGDSLVAVHVDAARRIEPRPPVGIARNELFAERIHGAEDMLRHVAKIRLRRSHDVLDYGLEIRQLPDAGVILGVGLDLVAHAASGSA